MRRISQVNPHTVKVESVMRFPKCEFCGSCHSADISKCPKIKWFDETFKTGRP